MEQHPLLSAQKESELLIAAQAGDDSALESLVTHNQRLVCSIANRCFYSNLNQNFL